MDFMVALPTIVKAMAMGAVPILLAALGEVFSEKAGLVNIGLEGIMAVGAFVAFAVGKVTGNRALWLQPLRWRQPRERNGRPDGEPGHSWPV